MKAGLLGIALAIGSTHVALGQDRGGSAPAQFDGIIARHAAANGVPEALIRRVIVRESRYNPSARNGGHYGMMQIKPATAKAMGYQGGPAGLLDADTNLTYAVRYLAGAYKVAGGDHDRAVRLYASGYYYDAKRKGMLAAVGLGRNGARTFVASAQPVGLPVAQPSPGAQPAAPVLTLAAADPAPPLPPTRDVAAAAPVVAEEAPRSFLFARRVAPSAPAATAEAPVVLAAAPAAPLPPVRGAGSTTLVAAAPASPIAPLPPSAPARPTAQPTIVAVAAPLPPVRAAAPTNAARMIAPNSAPVLASAAPVPPAPPSRATEAASTIAAAAPVPPARPAARVIAPNVAPVLASAGPVDARRPVAAAEPAALSYAATPIPPAREPAATGSVSPRPAARASAAWLAPTGD